METQVAVGLPRTGVGAEPPDLGGGGGRFPDPAGNLNPRLSEADSVFTPAGHRSSLAVATPANRARESRELLGAKGAQSP